MALPGTATVSFTWDTGGFAPDGEPIVNMTAAVTADGLPPYAATIQDRVPQAWRPFVTTGTVLPVVVDEEDPNVIRVEWDAFERRLATGQGGAQPPAAPSAPTPPAATPPPPPTIPPPPEPLGFPSMPTVPPLGGGLPTMPSVPPVSPVGPEPPVSSPPAGNEVVTQLERLNELRERGALTQAEYDLAKARILGEL